MTGTIAVAPATGAVGASVSAQTGLNDPGAASAGLCARCVAFPVTTAIPTSTVVNVSWTGTVVVRAVAFMKVSSAGTTGYRTNSGATGTNSVNGRDGSSSLPRSTTPKVCCVGRLRRTATRSPGTPTPPTAPGERSTERTPVLELRHGGVPSRARSSPLLPLRRLTRPAARCVGLDHRLSDLHRDADPQHHTGVVSVVR